MKSICLPLCLVACFSTHAIAETLDGRVEGAVAAVPSPAPVVAPRQEVLPGRSDQDIPAKDQVIADDLIVQFSACIGIDCVNGEDFGFDTIRLKENNTRIKFDDTSTGAFPANDWQLTANDSASGAANKFSIEDITGATVPFTIMAAAPSNSMFVDATGRVGFRTSTPVLDLHVNTSNTPALRLEQNNSGGFTAQTWDIAGNEANFFVRDVTGGSRLPLRIRPGAPTSAIDILAGGVAINGSSASANLQIHDNIAAGTPDASLRITNSNYSGTSNVRFEVDSDGNVTARGAITQLSSLHSKENFNPVDGRSVLERLAGIPIQTWNYIGQHAADQHMGPVAEDFHAAFGLGQDATRIALSDMAGVALAAVQELHQELQARDRQIAEQEQRLRALEAKLAQLGEK